MDDNSKNQLKEWFMKAKKWAFESPVRALLVGIACGWVLRGVL